VKKTTPWILGGCVTLVALLSVPLLNPLFSEAIIKSPPDQVRPWATEDFLKLTAPVPSPDSPADPKYAARHGGASKSTNPNFEVSIVVDPARLPFVPNYEVIQFDAAEGFATSSGSGKLRWMAGAAYNLPENWSETSYSKVLSAFHPDGRPMQESEKRALGITRRDLEAWGLQQEGEGGTSMILDVELQDFANLQHNLRGIFDASTHASVSRWFFANPTQNGLSVRVGATVLHDTPLLAVIDLAHGETQDSLLPLAKGAVHTHADFSVEIIEFYPGSTSSGQANPAGLGRTQSYGVDKSSTAAKSFSVIYQINPPSMATAVSVDAIDLSGKRIEAGKPFIDQAPVRNFAAPLASCASLQIRYRPKQTRLLLNLKATPGLDPANLNPMDLFDVRAPTVTFRSTYEMRRFISELTQLKDITASPYHSTLASFPLTLTNVSPRDVLERYLAIDPRHKAKIDATALTIEFEQPPTSSWLSRKLARIKRFIGL
jgi:hypothetical protein